MSIIINCQKLSRMVESKGIKSEYSLLSFVRGVRKEELWGYTLTYLEKHVYISSKNLTSAYLYDYYDLTHTSMDYRKIKNLLSHKFGNIISVLLRENRILGYSPKLYKRVDIINSKTKITPQGQKEISTNDNSKVDTPSPDIKNNASHLIYYQGRFMNPKDYDIKHYI